MSRKSNFFDSILLQWQVSPILLPPPDVYPCKGGFVNMKLLPFILIAVIGLALYADSRAEEDKEQTTGIVPKGDASVGLSTFIDKGCFKCHIAGKAKLPDLTVPSKLSIQLGGAERQNWSRDQFARAIMNPNHAVAPEYHIARIVVGDKLGAENSPMPAFNDILTLKDLINLTTFLESLTP